MNQDYHELWQEEYQRRVELERILDAERKIHLRIAIHADKLHMQLQAIRDAALGELCGIVADGPENLNGLQERE
jgi:hypothetical protein